MNILFLTQVLPYPPNAGPRVKTYNVLRYLVGTGHKIHLATFLRPEEARHLDELRAICSSIHTIEMRRSKTSDLVAWVRSIANGKPFLVERDGKRAMNHLVRHLLSNYTIDAIHVDQVTMTQFVMTGTGIREMLNRDARLIFDAHNAVWQVVKRFKGTSPRAVRAVLDLEARRIKKFEGRAIQEFDQTIAVSDMDREALLEAAEEYSHRGVDNHQRALSSKITVIPIAIDTEEIQPAETRSQSSRILALGSLHYPPNADGIRWFVRAVFPKIRSQHPSVELTIVGKNPPPDIKSLNHTMSGAVEVTGYVDDLDPYFASSALMVVPVRSGGGIRVRILEGFCRAMPMVTTSLGLEGIGAVPERDILVADDPDTFSDMVLKLLSDSDLSAQLGRNGRKLAERTYDWRTALEALDKIYENGKVPAVAPV